MVCAAVYGGSCFTGDPGYTAVAALTNIPATIVGAAIHIFLLSDSARPLALSLPDADGPSMRVITREITREQQYGAEKRA